MREGRSRPTRGRKKKGVDKRKGEPDSKGEQVTGEKNNTTWAFRGTEKTGRSGKKRKNHLGNGGG